jgi:secreted trypsin-like serine protease
LNKLLPLIAFSVLLLVPAGAQNAFSMEQMVGPLSGTHTTMILPNGITVTMAPMYTVVDGTGTHATAPGGALDGVADLLLTNSAGSTFRCTGSLLESDPLGGDNDMIILTAAHCLDTLPAGPPVGDGVIDIVSGTAKFERASGDEIIAINAAWSIVHPNWDADFIKGNDIALIELVSAPSSDVNRYVYDTNPADDIGSMPVQAGYGKTGTGLTGDTMASGIKHDVQNTFDSDSDDMNANLLGEIPGVTTVADAVLITDFDDTNNVNGGGAIDACAIWNVLGFGFVCPADAGKGVNEGLSASGDSGGPSFTSAGPNTITGVTSYGITFGFPGQSDVDNALNSSFGEFAGYTRVAAYSTWITDTLTDIGKIEPGPTQPTIVAGEILPIDSAALLLAGAQTNAVWMLPLIVIAAAIGIVVSRKF